MGLYALQHRGQESAGIAVSENGRLTAVRDLGLVPQVFDERTLSGLRGEYAIGHTRYSTTGGNAWENAHRFSLAHDISDGGVELALAEAAAWSGRDFVLSQPADGEGVVVATSERPAWDDVVELGMVA